MQLKSSSPQPPTGSRSSFDRVKGEKGGGGVGLKFKEGLKEKEKKFWNTSRQLNVPERANQIGGQLFGVLCGMSRSIFGLFET